MTKTDPPRIPTGQELFDSIMEHIEPELTSQGVKKLAETYKNETPADQATRKQRYELAFERYEQAYQGYLDTLQAQVERYRHESFRQVELEDQNKEQSVMQRLQQSIFQIA